MNVSEKANLFTYATKELSQDAFLMWVLSNYDDEGDVGRAAKKLLAEFCHLDNDEVITNLTVRPQEGKIDISVYFDTNKREKLGLFIEDKTGSNEHNQLETYNDYINKKLKETEITEAFRIFYKTGIFDDDELERVEKAEWKIYGMKEILNIWEEFKESPNMIIKMYVNHLYALQEAIKNKKMPSKYTTDKLNRCEWYGFFYNTVVPRLNAKFKSRNVKIKCGLVGQYSYAVICAWYKNMKKIPYLEIRDRDCVNGNIISRVLCYDMENNDLKARVIEIIGKSGNFSQKNMKSENPQQIGKLENRGVKTVDDIVEKAANAINAYIEVMEVAEK